MGNKYIPESMILDDKQENIICARLASTGIYGPIKRKGLTYFVDKFPNFSWNGKFLEFKRAVSLGAGYYNLIYGEM